MHSHTPHTQEERKGTVEEAGKQYSSTDTLTHTNTHMQNHMQEERKGTVEEAGKQHAAALAIVQEIQERQTKVLHELQQKQVGVMCVCM